MTGPNFLTGPVRAELHATLRLALPMVVIQVTAIGSNVVDVVLAGHLGAEVLGAVAVGANIYGFVLMGLVGFMMALAPSVAQLDGAGRRGEVAPLFRQALFLAFVLGLGAAALLWFAAPAVVRLSGADPALTAGAVAFLHAVAFGAPALALSLACRGLTEGLSMPRPSLVIGIGGLLVMIPVGTTLMYGLHLGPRGSGITSAMIDWLQLGARAIYIARSRKLRGLGWERWRRGPDRGALLALARLGLPMASSTLMEVGMFTAATLLIGRFGAAAVGSHQIALNISSLTFMAPLGLAMAVTVRVGNAAGAGDAIGTRRAGLTGLFLAAGTQALSCIMLLSIPAVLAGLYTDDASVIQGAVVLLSLAAIFQISDGVQVVCNGALRGLKDARLPMLITGVAYWAIGLPLGWALAFQADMRSPGMWTGLIVGLTVAAMLLLTRFLWLTRLAVRVPA